METVRLEFDQAGKAAADWWTKETGRILCDLCGECAGFDSGEKPLECVAGNPWCG